MTYPNAHPPSEARLFELFAKLPMLSPAAGFVHRVMAALPRRSWLDSAWTRGWLAAAMLAVAVAAALLVPTAVSLARLAGPATILSYWTSAVADLLSGLGESLGTWDRLADLGRALGKAFARPEALALLMANVAVAVAAFRGLLALTPRRSTSHVALVS